MKIDVKTFFFLLFSSRVVSRKESTRGKGERESKRLRKCKESEREDVHC